MSKEAVLEQELVDEILRDTKTPGKLNKAERMLRKTIVELVSNNRSMFLFLKDDEVRTYWEKLVEKSKKDLANRKEAWRVYNIKLGVYERLSPDDRKLLGINKPRKPAGEPV